MSRLCAKPTCSDVAERWFDVCAAECEVVERSEPTPSTIAFCGSHAARFSVPVGWAWIALDRVEETATIEANASEPAMGQDLESSVGSISTPHRLHTRDAPWFLANASLSDEASEAAELADATELSDSDSESTLSAGSLLHRAFHGPDRDHDVARARDADRDHGGRREERTQSQSKSDDDDDDVATVRDLASQRSARATTARSNAARSSTTSYDVELPFPPVDAEPHVAVS